MKLTGLPELNRRAFAILARELGVPDTIRFFSQFNTGGGNYTEVRRQLFAGLTLEEYRRVVGALAPDSAETDDTRPPSS